MIRGSCDYRTTSFSKSAISRNKKKIHSDNVIIMLLLFEHSSIGVGNQYVSPIPCECKEFIWSRVYQLTVPKCNSYSIVRC